MQRQRLFIGLVVTLTGTLSLAAVLGASGAAPVADAAMLHNADAVRALLRQGADVNAPQGDGMTALHWAAMKGDAEMASLLLSAGANVKATTRIGAQTPLHVAGKIGNPAVLTALLKAGSDANAATDAGTTPLMLAAAAGNPVAVKTLVAYGANVNVAEAAKGHTPLMFAAAANRAEVVKVLLEVGADARAVTRVFDLSQVDIPADRSAQANAVTKFQREANAARANNATRKPPVAGVDRRYEQNDLVAAQGGLTALHFAARQGHIESVKALVEGGVDLNHATAAVHVSPLVIAIVNGHFDLARYLLDKGANPNLVAENGVAPLYAVLNCQWSDVVEYPQPQAYLQQKTSYLDLMKALLEKGADPNARLKKKVWYSGYARDLSSVDEIGATPFWRAAYANDVDAMRLLVTYGADGSIPTMSSAGRPPLGMPNQTPLHAAADFHIGARTHPAGWRPALEYLIGEHAADVNGRDNDGNTSVHFAAARGDNEMVLYLVSKGADVKVVNKRGQTTVDVANGPEMRVQPYPETIKLLESLGAKNNHKCVSC